MRLSDDTRTSLEGLLAGLRGGLPGGQGYSIFMDTLAQQQAQNEARKNRLLQYAQQVAGLASGGQPYSTAYDMMDLVTPRAGVPGRVSSMLDIAYPDDQNVAPFYGAETHQVPTDAQYQQAMGDRQSPMYTNDPNIQMQEQAAAIEQQQMLQDLALDQRWQEMSAQLVDLMQSEISASPDAPIDPSRVANAARMAFPDLLAADPVKFQQVIEAITGVKSVMSGNEAAALAIAQLRGQ